MFNSLFDKSILVNSVWKMGTSLLDDDFINIVSNRLDDQKINIVDFSSEHWGDSLSAYNQLADSSKKFIYLTHNEADHLSLPNYLYFPHHYFGENHLILPQPNAINTINKKYKISCLNGNPHVHRIYNLLLLKDKPYFNDLLFTFHNTDEPWRSDSPELSQEMKSEWERIRSSYNNRGGRETFFLPNGENSHPAFSDSYINLITETSVNPKVFITEKTWKSIATGQLFILLGNQGSIQHLRNLGVDTFDDYIDHSYYDNEPNWQQRINKIHDLVDYFMSLDNSKLQQINQETYQRRLTNSENYFSGRFVSKYINCLREKINELNQNVL